MAEGVKTNGFNKKKVQGFLDELDQYDHDSTSEHAKVTAKYQPKYSALREAAAELGIKPSVWGSIMSEHRLRRKADAQRDKFAEAHSEHQDLVDQRDNVALAAGLPLFDDAEERETGGKGAEKKQYSPAAAGDAHIAAAIAERAGKVH